ncbi:hypothetical protein Celaphus_00006964, partial [Cervus elaphus hippelaphus]
SLSLDSSCFSSPPVNFLQELPSYRSIARKRTTILSRDKQNGTLLKPTDSYNFQLEGEITEDLDNQSIRKYALNISEKRRLRDIQETQMKYLSEWDQWKRYSSKSWKRFIEKAREMTTHLELYKITNSSFILIPSKDVDIQCTVYPISSSGLIYFYSYVIDLLSGTGFLEDTYLFYGHYTIDGVKFQNFIYDLPLAYLLSTIAYLALSLVWIVKRSVEGFKINLIRSEEHFQSYCNKIFAGWDFCITNRSMADLKHSSLRYELRFRASNSNFFFLLVLLIGLCLAIIPLTISMARAHKWVFFDSQADLEEERIRQKIAERTSEETIRIYSLRLFLNCIVLAVLAACFYAIYRATIFSQEHMKKKAMRSGSSSWVPVGEAFWVCRGGVLSLCCRPGPEPHALCPGSIPSSKACGPFTNFNTTWEVVPKTVSTFPNSLQTLVYGITSEAFAVPFFMIICCGLGAAIWWWLPDLASRSLGVTLDLGPGDLQKRRLTSLIPVALISSAFSGEIEQAATSSFLIMFYFIALAGAHKRVVVQLREQLNLESRDKRYLIQKLTEAQRDLRNRLD